MRYSDYYYLHITDREMEAQRGQGSCLEPHVGRWRSQQTFWKGVGLKSGWIFFVFPNPLTWYWLIFRQDIGSFVRSISYSFRAQDSSKIETGKFGDVAGNGHQKLKVDLKKGHLVQCVEVRCFTHHLLMNVSKNLKTFGSLKCLRWPLSYLIYFTLDYLLRKGIPGTSQLPYCLDILNSVFGDFGINDVVCLLKHLEIKIRMYITKNFFFSWTIENKSSLLNTLVSFFFFSCKQQYSPSSVALNVGSLNQQHQHLLIPHQAGKFSSPTPDLLNQKLRDEVQLSTTYSTSVLDDSDEHSRLYAMYFVVS